MTFVTFSSSGSSVTKTFTYIFLTISTMLLTEGLLDNIVAHLKVLKICGPFPFRFDKKNGLLRCSSSANILKAQITIALLSIICFLLWAQIWLYQDNFEIVVIYEGMLYSASDIVLVTGSLMFLIRRNRVIELFNLILKFEKNQLNSGQRKLHYLDIHRYFSCRLIF